jgi:hypothetical protein
MVHAQPSPFLRQALLADALITGATALLLILGAGLLTGLLDLPAALLRYAGLILVPFVVFVGYIARREHINRSQVWTVIVANALWAAASIGLLFSSWVAPNLLGSIFVIFQALVVAVFAELQYMGMRRTVRAAA